MMPFVKNDGGRLAAGWKGKRGDCVTRAVAIVSGLPYQTVYEALSDGVSNQRHTRRSGARKTTARDGVRTQRKWFKDYMASLGFRWVPAMAVGTAERTHLNPEELPSGRLVVALRRHYTAVIDGVIHDTGDPQRGSEYRMVYGYWTRD